MMLSFASCEIINEWIDSDSDTSDSTEDNTNQTTNTDKLPGDSHFHETTGLYWLETYEEVLEAVELLKSHGSTIEKTVGFNCEDEIEIFDEKWCFVYQKSKAEPLEDGKEFFDRKIDDGEFRYFAFKESVTIDELVHRGYHMYDCIYVRQRTPFDPSLDGIESIDEVTVDWFGKEEFGLIEPPGIDIYFLYCNGICIAEIGRSTDYNNMPLDYMDEFFSTAVIIG